MKIATITTMRFYLTFALAAVLLGGISSSLYAEDTDESIKPVDRKNKLKAQEPKEWFVVEVADLFDERIISICSSDERDAIAKSVSKKNRSLDQAHRQCAQKWTESEKQRVEPQKASKKKKAPIPPPRPFVLPKPGLVSIKVNGPFQEKTDAEQNAAERAAALQKEIDYAVGAESQSRKLLSAQMLASLKAKEADEAEQRELFMTELESFNGKNSMLGGRGQIKLMGRKSGPLVKNQHRISNPGANAKTATKVDPRTATK